MMRIGIAEDQALVRESLAIVLNLQEDVQVAWTADTGLEAVQFARESAVDVILMDLRMPELDGISAIRQIRLLQPMTKFVVLTTFDHDEWLMEALHAGAVACFLKEVPPAALVDGLRKIHAGTWRRDVLPAAAIQYVPDVQFQVQREDFSHGLTSQEVAVLRRLARGETNAEIADAMHLSRGTVKNYVSILYGKLGVRHRVEAVAAARRLGIW